MTRLGRERDDNGVALQRLTAEEAPARAGRFAWILSGAQEKSPIAFKNAPICEIRERNQHHAHVTVCGTLTVDQQCGTHCANCVLRELY